MADVARELDATSLAQHGAARRQQLAVLSAQVARAVADCRYTTYVRKLGAKFDDELRALLAELRKHGNEWNLANLYTRLDYNLYWSTSAGGAGRQYLLEEFLRARITRTAPPLCVGLEAISAPVGAFPGAEEPWSLSYLAHEPLRRDRRRSRTVPVVRTGPTPSANFCRDGRSRSSWCGKAARTYLRCRDRCTREKSNTPGQGRSRRVSKPCTRCIFRRIHNCMVSSGAPLQNAPAVQHLPTAQR